MFGKISLGVLLPRFTTNPKKLRASILVMLLAVMVVSPAATTFALQDPLDEGGPDSVYLIIDKTAISPEDSGLVATLYLRNDAQELGAIAATMGWDNSDIRLDSVVLAPEFDGMFDILDYYYDGRLDSSNIYRKFQFIGINLFPPYIGTSDVGRPVAHFYFGTEDWGWGDSCCIDTASWRPVTNLELVEPNGPEYIPVWGGAACAQATGFERDCFGTLGSVQLVPECDSTDQFVDILDIQMLIEYEFLSLTPLCWWREADLDFSGFVDITDLQIMVDHQFLSLEPFPECK